MAKKDLYKKIKGKKNKVSIKMLEENVVGLFDDCLNSNDFDKKTNDALARVRAKIIIEFEQLKK